MRSLIEVLKWSLMLSHSDSQFEPHSGWTHSSEGGSNRDERERGISNVGASLLAGVLMHACRSRSNIVRWHLWRFDESRHCLTVAEIPRTATRSRWWALPGLQRSAGFPKRANEAPDPRAVKSDLSSFPMFSDHLQVIRFSGETPAEAAS